MFKKLFLTTGSVAMASLPLISTVACGTYKELHLKVNVYFLPGDDVSTKTEAEVDGYIAMMNLIGYTFVADNMREISELEFTLVDVNDDDNDQVGVLNASQLVNPLDTDAVYSTFREFIEIPEDENYLQSIKDIYEPYAGENEIVWGGVLGLEIFKLLHNNITTEE